MNLNDYYRDQYGQRSQHTATQKLTSVDSFCRRYDVKVTDSEHRRARREAVPNWDMDYTKYRPVEYRVEYEQLVALHMPKASFDRLMDLEHQIERLQDHLIEYQRREQSQHRDAEVRQTTPAVQRAWEHYQMLLGLAR